jgi:hypothetical protein
LSLLGSQAVQAAEWSLASSAQGRLRYTQDRPDAPGLGDSVFRESRVAGNLNVARSLDNSATRLEAALDLPIGLQSGGRTLQGRLALGQTLSTELDSLSARLERTADQNQADQRSASDALVGRSRRNGNAFSASWQRALAPRLSAQAGISSTQAGYGDAQLQAPSYRNSQGNASLSYRWDELTTLGLSASRSRYTAGTGGNLTRSDNVGLSFSRSLDETSSMNLSLGGYRTEQQGRSSRLACPLPVSYCSAGLVAPVVVQDELRIRSSGTQYSLNLQSSLSETRNLGLVASRQLSPSAFGVVQADSLSVNLTQALSPQLNLTLSASQSRSRSPGSSGDARPVLSTLDSALGWNLQERLSLTTGLTLRRFREPAAGVGSKSLQFSISLQYQPLTILSTR